MRHSAPLSRAACISRVVPSWPIFVPALILALSVAQPAPARHLPPHVADHSTAHPNQPVFIVRDDRGGLVSDRQAQIRRLQQKNTRIEIRGTVCLSSCTMYLGADNVCVVPRTRFGFHGPSDHGKPLSHPQFDYWSQVIADHYPKHLARWYMQTARHLSQGYYHLTGAQLIEMGFPNCDADIH